MSRNEAADPVESVASRKVDALGRVLPAFGAPSEACIAAMAVAARSWVTTKSLRHLRL